MKAKKRYGQHFLHSSHVIDRLVGHIQPAPELHCLEIGPGHGVLTAPLLKLGAYVTAVEIDNDLIDELRTKFEPTGRFHLIHQDVLDVDLNAVLKKNVTVVGNLPYNISTPILFALIPFSNRIDRCYFMLQKEVVLRLAGQPSTKDYGRLSIMIQYHFKVKSLFDVPPGAFSPPPKVNSAIVELIPITEHEVTVKSMTLFENILRVAFSHRRKTLSNCLKSFISAEGLRALGFSPMLRPENLSVNEWVRLCNGLPQIDSTPNLSS